MLGLDLPLYTSALPEADEEYRRTYLSFVEHLVRDLPGDRRRALPPTLRLYLELAEAGRMEDLVAAVRARRGARAWATDDSRGRLQRIREDLATYRLERSWAGHAPPGDSPGGRDHHQDPAAGPAP